jgi:hypothetical protein
MSNLDVHDGNDCLHTGKYNAALIEGWKIKSGQQSIRAIANSSAKTLRTPMSARKSDEKHWTYTADVGYKNTREFDSGGLQLFHIEEQTYSDELEGYRNII